MLADTRDATAASTAESTAAFVMASPRINNLVAIMPRLLVPITDVTRRLQSTFLTLRRPGGDGRAGRSLRAAFQKAGQFSTSSCGHHSSAVCPVSNFISKKLCILEIDLEITTALPDKAYRPIQPPISKSPNIFASGGTATFRTAPS